MRDEDLADEILEKAHMDALEDDISELPEAPASANTRVQLPSGRQYQITMRTLSVNTLIKQIEVLEDRLTTKGWHAPDWQIMGVKKPIMQQSFGTCPVCGEGEIRENIVKKESKNKGRKFRLCSVKDCTYFEWV